MINLLVMETLLDRLKWSLTQSGIKKIDLAREAGVSRAAVTAWFNGTTKKIEGANLVNVARALKVNPLWLATGKGERLIAVLHKDQVPPHNLDVNVVDEIRGIMWIPVISWVQAGTFCSAVDMFEPGDAEEWLPAQSRMGKHAYALRVVGDSMVAPHGRASYWPGMTIYVDPDEPVINGSHVIAKIPDTAEATFKVFREDGGKRLLVPLNPQYPTIEMTPDMTICGVVVGVFFSTK